VQQLSDTTAELADQLGKLLGLHAPCRLVDFHSVHRLKLEADFLPPVFPIVTCPHNQSPEPLAGRSWSPPHRRAASARIDICKIGYRWLRCSRAYCVAA